MNFITIESKTWVNSFNQFLQGTLGISSGSFIDLDESYLGLFVKGLRKFSKGL